MKRYFAVDFENTVPKAGEDWHGFTTRVWAVAMCEVGTENVNIFESIAEFMQALEEIGGTITLYTHNLSYDGLFVLDYLINNGYVYDYHKKWSASGNTVSGIISGGAWFSLYWKIGKQCRISLKDSLKILPMSIDQMAKDFNCKHRKLTGTIDYEIERPEGWKITKAEREYISNDVLILSEVLEKVKPLNLLDHLTIGSACMADFKESISRKVYNQIFAELSPELDKKIRPAYVGGWCYIKPEVRDMITGSGAVYDCNSMYPYVMHSTSGNVYPWGEPWHFDGKDFEKYLNQPFIIRATIKVALKEDHLPFLREQSILSGTCQYIEGVSDYINIVISKPDYELLSEQYHILYFCCIEGWAFRGAKGIFDKYIDKWYKMKKKYQPGTAQYRVSKLMLNNLSGKMGTRTDITYREPYIDENGIIQYKQYQEEKTGIYLPIAIFLTAYARCLIVRSAQANYNIFAYSDTDSLHLLGDPEGLEIGYELGQFKTEAIFKAARYVNPKTYVEVNEDKTIVKAAGLSKDAARAQAQYGDILEKYTGGYTINDNKRKHKVKGGNIIVTLNYKLKGAKK